jgi:hypothetical protein
LTRGRTPSRRPRPALAARTPGDRPLRALADADVAARLQAALAAGDGVEGAHCVHEQWMRGAFPTLVETALAQLWQRAAATIPEWLPMRYIDWLPRAYEVAAAFRATGRGRSNVYLVLLDYADRRGDPHGVYVGMTHYRPAQRFDQHKAGIRASGAVLKRGLELLAGPTLHLQRIPRAEAARIERDLAQALGAAGILTQGGH